MVYIKKLVIYGFKSFAKRTEIVFDKEVNVILGANGSGKSNVSDAICFALGRLSIKSMRAAKAKNLLFLGSKYVKPVKEAYVELVFDNSSRLFGLDTDEVSLARIVKRNGQSIYKINAETKTRTEVIELLAQAGIDPHGFNIILQGQIQYIVRMHSEERRKIIEEVAGISIYESKKEKSLHELEKTEEKLKDISATLRERRLYLKNLEEERAEALKFQELQVNLKKYKASILTKKIEEKQKELDKINASMEEKVLQKDKLRATVQKNQAEIQDLQEKIMQINKSIQQATGVEQESLHNQIANLKAEIEGLKVRKEGYENRKNEVERRIDEIKNSMPNLEKEIVELRQESPILAKKAQDLKKKKDELAKIEEERNKLINLRTEFFSLKEISKDKEKQLTRAQSESESILRQIEEISTRLSLKSEEECIANINSFRQSLQEKEKRLLILHETELTNAKLISVAESEIERNNKIKSQVEKIDICPLCQSKITPEHINHVSSHSNEKIKEYRLQLESSQKEIQKIHDERNLLNNDIRELKLKLLSIESELIRHKNIKDKKEQLKNHVNNEKSIKDEMIRIEERRKVLEVKIIDLPKIEEKYDSILLEIEEISSRTKDDADTALLYKERELENIRNIIKHSSKDLITIKTEIDALTINNKTKSDLLITKQKQEEELNTRFKKMFETRDNIQKSIHEKSINLSEIQNEIRNLEEQINYFKIGKAKLEAERDAVSMEMQEFTGLEIIKASFEVLEEKIKKTQETLNQIGSINMRALEVYDGVKKEYDLVEQKVQTLEKEKEEIMKIIDEIDKKKMRSFMKTFRSMNELFTRNFSRLYNKGIAYLELENEEDIFTGGVNIVVKLAKGKYFDVTSLSGGEQTLVALSLLFAIQEYKPYHFYIFDEIDAALDKRNSERLASLINQYMKSGQYIVITHNDAIIMKSNVLYGVSMHEGVSKVLSLKVSDAKNMADQIAQEERLKALEDKSGVTSEGEGIEQVASEEDSEEEDSQEEEEEPGEEPSAEEIEEIESEENLEDIKEKDKLEFK